MTAATDVVVVGAGLAGLSAARRLMDAGAEVVVLEARERVGGRTLTLPAADGTPIDHGGQWIGPTQYRIAALAERVGVTTYPSYERGLNTEFRDGRAHRFDGQLPGGGDPVTAVGIGQAIRELDAMAAEVPLEAPWTAAQALAWDSQTVETWLQLRVSADRARAWLRAAIRGTLAAEPRDLSLLHTLFFIRSAGGIAPLIATAGGAQELRFHQGAQTVSIRLAESLGGRVVLGAPAEVVRHGEGGVEVQADGRTVTGGRAILAVPPAVAGRIGYRPGLPGWRNQLAQRVPMGSVIKVHALYDEPFWRDEGLSGFAVSDSGPVSCVYDNSPEAGAPGVLVGFIEGEHARTWARRNPADRRAGVLARLVDYFGHRAGRPRELLERSWADEEYSGGCYAGYFPPGVWTSFGQALREPIGRLHWAGTETATAWTSYMEGAVQSGERAADEVLAAS
ncbi:MAG TPA: flavin monoamine oxidase family protein [Actinomycetes bacterium]|nr:flavin monoamine oxidase family protein [Actinomycetes bacterium]